MDVRLKHPFTMCVVGPTFSGKTFFVRKLLKHIHLMMNPAPQKIVWFYGEFQKDYAEMMNTIPEIEFHENLPEDFYAFTDSARPTLFIIDDLMDVVSDSKKVAALFTKGCHHRNVSLIYLTQNLFKSGKESRTISLNTQYYCLFKNCRDKIQITCLGRQMYPGRTKYFQEAYADATREKYGYLFIDLKPDTPEDFRLRTNIFPGETQFAYLPRV